MRSNGHAKGILGKLTNQNFTDVYTRACGFISHICEKDIRCLYSGGVLTRTNTVRAVPFYIVWGGGGLQPNLTPLPPSYFFSILVQQDTPSPRKEFPIEILNYNFSGENKMAAPVNWWAIM